MKYLFSCRMASADLPAPQSPHAQSASRSSGLVDRMRPSLGIANDLIFYMLGKNIISNANAHLHLKQATELKKARASRGSEQRRHWHRKYQPASSFSWRT